MKINIVIEPKLLPTACSRLMEKKTETAVITHWLYSMLIRFSVPLSIFWSPRDINLNSISTSPDICV